MYNVNENFRGVVLFNSSFSDSRWSMARTRPGMLVVPHVDGNRGQVELTQAETTLGRSDTCTVILPFATVSRLHARIQLEHNRYVLFDAGSANGTFVNGELIQHPHQLSTGDEIWLGTQDVALGFADPDETMQVPLNTDPPVL